MRAITPPKQSTCNKKVAKYILATNRIQSMCCIFRPAFLLVFSWKSKKFEANFFKNMFFEVCTRALVDCFISKKMSFFLSIHVFTYEIFFWEYNSRPAFWCKLKKPCFLLKFSANFLLFCRKTLKMTISTSIWGAQHPNPGQNKQHTMLFTGHNNGSHTRLGVTVIYFFVWPQIKLKFGNFFLFYPVTSS